MFPTPVYTVALPDGPALSAALRDVVLRRGAEQRGVSRSNVGGWQSEIDMLRWGGEPAEALAQIVTRACTQMTALADDASAAPIWRPEMWANINRSGDSNQNHWHPGSFLSFVYYVDDGYAGSADPALGGELVFVDPRMPFLRMRTPHLRHRAGNGSVEEQETWVRPFSGLLIGFPSFLGHSVRPYHGTGTRISIAINMIARAI
ncbi:TIGR02466 family protein [Sphingomonas sp. TX0543]|uniref:TIGR02466 family protein n=1 Tax=unclassified Sphingomonas TaxID=196159 RepID=UPI0010F4480E|nr:TIGR02466 family protein [Sphingomonas sp. 3P27F8]